LSDLALRNAVLRISPEMLMADDNTLGRYAENLVFLALKKLRGSLQIDYFRDRNEEIDFIVHSGAERYLPIEVKYRNAIPNTVLLQRFRRNYPKSSQPILVTKSWEQFGLQDGVFHWPLPLFLLMFG
jgi:predicted AAA+ superfamily ATPase